MERIEKSIEVHVPVRTAYNQWTQFEAFPQFMEGVEEVHQTDDRHVHWVADIGGKRKEWDSEISVQEPDKCVAWRSVAGARNDGRVEFSPLSAGDTRVTVTMDYDPEGVVENVGDFFGVTSRRVEGDLQRFKSFIESRGSETGAWRGKIEGGGTPMSGASSSSAATSRVETGGTAIGGTRSGTEPGGRASGDLARYDPAFRTDFEKNYAHLGGRYEDYEPAYRYGSSLRQRQTGGAWSDLESDARRDWESRQPGTWERFKDAIRRGWEAI